MRTNFTEALVPLKNINFENTDYKISKPVIPNHLFKSIQRYGILEKPVLLKEKDDFIIVFGHNRLKAANILQQTQQACIILDSFDPEYFFFMALRKLYHDEVGQLSKIKLVEILQTYAHQLQISINDFAMRELGIPEYFMSSDLFEKALSLPPALKQFIEIKDLGYKTIRDLVRLSAPLCATISNWVEMIPFRVNIFRQIVEILYDLERMGKSNIIQQIKIPLDYDARMKEKFLLEQLVVLRYPTYWHKKTKADLICEKLKKNGINVSFPEFFEGNEATFSFNVSKKQKSNGISSKLTESTFSLIDELLDLL